MKNYRIFSLFLTVLTLAGCTRNAETGTPDANPVQTERAETQAAESAVLTNVFAGKAFAFPEGTEVCDGVKPYYDAEAGTYTVLSETESDAGVSYSLVSFTADGTITAMNSLALPEEVTFPRDGVVFGNGVVFRLSTLDMTTYSELSTLVRVTGDGGIVYSEDLTSLCGLESDFFFSVDYAVDADGWTYLLLEGDVFVLDEQLALQFSLTGNADTLTDVDGTVWVGTPYSIAPVDKNARSLGTETALPAGLTAEACFPGTGFALCYRTSGGIYGINTDGTTELLMNFENSGLIGNDVSVLHTAGRDTFLLSDGKEIGLWQRAADIDLSDVTVLRLAYTGNNTFLLREVVEFNKTHPDVRILTKDYNVYDGDSILLNESTMLIPDMLTGVYRPDIITLGYGYTMYDGARRDYSAICENNLYTDLYTLLDADETLSRDDVFGCVRRTFESEDGNLTALCSTFRVATLSGRDSLLGGRESWTLTEMVEFAESLPEGVTLMPELAANTAPEMLLGINGYASFVDAQNGTCSFDSPEFISYLEFLSTLPEKFDYSTYDRNAARADAAAGKYALVSKNYLGQGSWLSDEFTFQTTEFTRIGYPSGGTSAGGTYIEAQPYLITSFCGEPEAAWEFLKEILFDDSDKDYSSALALEGGFPALKPLYEKVSEASQNSFYTFTERGLSSYGPYDPERAIDGRGVVRFFTEENDAELTAWLDNEIGIRLAGAVSPEITDIVNEEISAYLGGVRTAEACADIIQSRVGIWLSEHE